MNGLRRGLTALAVVTALLAALVAPAAAQLDKDKPVASIKKGDWSVGDKMFVEGNNWPRGNVSVQVCGNGAANGTPDCDMPGSRNYGVSDVDGKFRGNVIVALPPAPCPCVVVVRSQSSSAQFAIPITINGAPVGQTTPLPKAPEKTTVRIATKVTDGPLWRDAFGLQPSRSVGVTISNTGTRPTGPGSVDITFGKSTSPTAFGETVPFASIEPGHQTTVNTEFPLDPVSIGDYHIRVSVDSANAHAEVMKTVSIQPWALGFVALVIVILLDILLIRRVWRNRRRREEESPPGAPEDPLPATDSLAAEPSDQLIDLSEPVPVLVGVGAATAGVAGGEESASSPLLWAPAAGAMVANGSNGHMASATRTVTFTLPGFADATTVAVCGTFNGWTPGTPLVFRNHGWTVKIDLEPGRTYRYRYLIDGERWVDDPLAVERVANEFGSEDCVVRT